mmetsp:Transcript_7397/g.25892  ORF Transcript_7397/g.25892 Transcript_7397/m.25892 type:complete len:279 (-) Transcript_7397:222-1058(-)
MAAKLSKPHQPDDGEIQSSASKRSIMSRMSLVRKTASAGVAPPPCVEYWRPTSVAQPALDVVALRGGVAGAFPISRGALTSGPVCDESGSSRQSTQKSPGLRRAPSPSGRGGSTPSPSNGGGRASSPLRPGGRMSSPSRRDDNASPSSPSRRGGTSPSRRRRLRVVAVARRRPGRRPLRRRWHSGSVWVHLASGGARLARQATQLFELYGNLKEHDARRARLCAPCSSFCNLTSSLPSCFLCTFLSRDCGTSLSLPPSPSSDEGYLPHEAWNASSYMI